MNDQNKKWNDTAVAKLQGLVKDYSGEEVPASVVEDAAEQLEVTTRSVAAKLRKLGYEVASMAKEKSPTFSVDEGLALKAFVERSAGTMTYAEIATSFMNGKFTPRQVQGKLLALEMTSAVKPTEKVEVARTYSEAEEAKFVKLANAGKFIEEIAEALGKSVASARGKALSLVRSGHIEGIPKQKESHAKDVVDAINALGPKIASMTVAEIATAVNKTERGIKTLLTRRGIKVSDYDGEAKRAKVDAKVAAAA